MRQLRQLARNAYRAGVEWSPFGSRIFWRMLPATGVAFTFDDGPNPEHTPQVLDLLAQYDARATFFLVGEQVERYPDLVRRIAAEGHAIGNHTYSHVRCRELDLPALRGQIERTDLALAAVLGTGERALPLFRPPFGELKVTQAIHLARTGRTLAYWNQDTRDYRGASAAEIAALGPTLTGGDIVLLHDRFPATVEALPALLEALQVKGLEARTLGPAIDSQPGSLKSTLGASRVNRGACL